MKKFLALIISLSMIIMCVPGLSLVASAATGTGTPDDPYIIATGDDFKALFENGHSAWSNFKQTANIDLGEWTPPTANVKFTKYDGGGYTIKYQIGNSTTPISTTDANNKPFGLFSTCSSVNFYNANVDATIYFAYGANPSGVGGFIGTAGYANFYNCTTDFKVIGQPNNFTGGFIGRANVLASGANQQVTFDGCTAKGSINAKYGNHAGFVGTGMVKSFKNCVNELTIPTGDRRGGDYAGFIAILTKNGDASTFNTTTFINCVNKADIDLSDTGTNADTTSGFIGTVKNVEAVTFEGCFNEGVVKSASGIVNGKETGPSYAGSFIGKIDNNTTYAAPTVTISNSYTTAESACKGSYSLDKSGAFVAANNSAATTLSIENSYYLAGEIPVGAGDYNEDNVYLAADLEGATIEDLGFDPEIWTIDDRYGEYGYKYPQLIALPVGSPDGRGSGESEADPIIVASGETFAAYFGKNVAADKLALVDGTTDYNTSGADNRYFLQICDITLPEGYAPHTTQTKWVYYNGNGYTINVDIKAADVIGNNVGIFGNTKWSNMKNVVIDGTIDATGYENVGGLLGYSDGGYFENITNKADVTGKAKVGGIIGYHSNAGNGTKNLTNYGEITGSGDEVGGITGSGYISAALEGYTNYGAVKGGNKVGGIWGVTTKEATVVTVTNFANIGTVTGMNSVGGIFGAVARTDLTVAESYNAGAINGNDDYYAAAIIAYPSSTGNITITDCFNTGIINTPNGAKGSAVTAVDKAGITVTVTNYYDAANKDIEVVELTNKSNGKEETDTTAVVTNAYILNASIKLDKAGAGESILAADLADKDFGANWVAPKGVLAYPQLANNAYEGLAVAEVAPAAIAAGTAAVAEAEVVLAGETYNNAAVFAAKILGDAAEYGFKVTYTNSGKVDIIYADNAVPGLTEGLVYGLLVYNIPEDSEIIVESFVEFDGVKYYGAAQKAFFAAPVVEETPAE